MAIRLSTPRVGDLTDVVRRLREWQHHAAPLQLHPGDLGWFWRFGAEATAAAVRVWSRGGRIVAVGLLDGPELVRLTMAPEARRDEDLARRLIADLADPERGVLPAGTASVEAPNGSLVAERLLEAGWCAGEAWTPLRRDLKEPVGEPGVRVEEVGPELVPERWRAMVTGPPYRDARCLIAYDGQGDAVAEVTVWSAGPGKPGLLEPMGVHADQRRRGYGRAVCLAAAAALRRMGSSSAIVCTPSANTAAVATYASAGFRPQPERRDRTRSA